MKTFELRLKTLLHCVFAVFVYLLRCLVYIFTSIPLLWWFNFENVTVKIVRDINESYPSGDDKLTETICVPW